MFMINELIKKEKNWIDWYSSFILFLNIYENFWNYKFLFSFFRIKFDKMRKLTIDGIVFLLFLGWLFAMEYIWPNSSGRLIMLIYFGGTLCLKFLHYIWYLSCPNDTEECCGVLVKFLGVIGSLLKFVDIRQITIGTQQNNGTYK
jgi:hypothetical protein